MSEALIQELTALFRGGPMAPVENPYPLYARLRREAPVLGLPRPDRPYFIVSRHAEARAVLRDDRVFSNHANARLVGLVMGRTLIEMDGPEHLTQRSLIAPSLAPRALRGDFPELVRRIADELIDGFRARGEADLAAEFTFAYPLRVFVEILGLPPHEIDEVHRLAIDLTHVAQDPARGIAGSQAMRERLLPEVERKRAAPGADLISRLATAEIGGERLSDEELVSFLRLLVVAGAETTYHLLGTAIHVLLQDPALLARIREDRSLLEPLLWEALRWESPISTVQREVREDTELAGVKLPAGSDVLVHVGSANRDELRFPDPDRFDLDRGDRDHLAFGLGKHYCAGSRLAILEARVGLDALLDRLPALRPAPGTRSRVVGFAFRGPDRLPVVFAPPR